MKKCGKISFFILILLCIYSITMAVSLSAGSLHGKWKLSYPGNYGYTFMFYKDYRTIITLYLGSYALIFKGIYSISDKNKLKVNIYEMKNETNPSRPNFKRGFMKMHSSYFLFKATIEKSGKSRQLHIVPLNTIIDGRNSGGYFEKKIKLTKV